MSDLKGIMLSSYTEELHYVSEEFNTETPWDSFDPFEAIGPLARQYVESMGHEKDVSFKKVAPIIPWKLLSKLSFDQLCKVYHSSYIMLDENVRNVFEKTSPQHVLLHKITSSMWRWGMNKSTWNNIVDAYNAIRSFDLGLPDFTVTLDHTPYVSPYGYGEHSNTVLDGVFGYLVHYKGEHVMTIGFSVITEKNILIQQVQLVKQKGNRFLFRFPKNRLEYIISRFEKAFVDHTFFVVDGAQIANRSLDSYTTALEYAQKWKRRDQEKLDDLHTPPDEREEIQRSFDAHSIEVQTLTNKINHLRSEMVRLKKFYAETGRYKVVDKCKINSLVHYQLAA